MQTIKITLLDVVNARAAANEVEKIRPANAKIAYRLGKALRQVKVEGKDFDDRRNIIIEDAGGLPEVGSDEFKRLEGQLNDILEEEVELRVATIPYAWVEREGDNVFSVRVFDAFWFMFDDEPINETPSIDVDENPMIALSEGME